MFSVSVVHDRDSARAEQWLRGEGVATIRTIGGPDPDGLLAIDRFRREAAERTQGAFTRLRFDVDQEHARTLNMLDVPVLTRRLEAALSRTLQEQMPRARGAFSVRFGGPQADPRAYVVLHATTRDGSPQRMLLRADVQALEASWERNVQREFGLRRGLDPLRDAPRDSPALQQVRELEFRWGRALSQVRESVGARMRGEIPQERLRAAIERAQEIQDKLLALRSALVGRPAGAIECVRLNVERGGEYLSRLAPKDADLALLRAVQEASGLDPRAAHELRLIASRQGADLRLAVYVVDDGNRLPSPVDLDALRAKLAERLAPEIEVAARQYDSLSRGTVGELGRVHPLGAEAAREPRRFTPILDERAPARAQQPVSVEFRLAKGARELGGYSPNQRAEILEKAVDRALPFLKESGIPREIRTQWEGATLRVNVSLPGDVGWTRDQLAARPFEARFVHEVNRHVALANGTFVPRDEAGPKLEIWRPSPMVNAPAGPQELRPEDHVFLRQVGIRVVNGRPELDAKAFENWLRRGLGLHRGPVPFREAPRSGFKEVAGALIEPIRRAWERVASVVPAPMRAAFVLARTVGRVIPRE